MYKSHKILDKNLLSIWLLKSRYASQSVLYKKQQNYYEILGVTKQASSKDLKVAYYKKCKQIHPDKNKNDPSSHQKFVALNQAYSILSDPTLRSKYDNNNTSSSYTYPHHQNYNEYSTRSNYYHNYYTDRMKEEQMRYDAHKRYYYYTNNQNSNSNSSYYNTPEDFKTPGQVLFFLSVIVLTIFMFDALFVNYAYQADMKRMNDYYSPMNKATQKELKKKMDRKMTKEDEDEIDKQIKIYKEIEDAPNIRIYKSEPFANSYDQKYAKK